MKLKFLSRNIICTGLIFFVWIWIPSHSQAGLWSTYAKCLPGAGQGLDEEVEEVRTAGGEVPCTIEQVRQ